ncbi:uncharacterized protein A4U43_C01F23850 [Asparagus officinalis]|uniref:Uncharacterized protein n=1 Tax=Asparagus officinalis TaxID=4686 RepID=A0A5P1FSA0_ASPOF|nr:uncharacterized protein A4U43_C01F23850 [Asparagus officinalis]
MEDLGAYRQITLLEKDDNSSVKNSQAAILNSKHCHSQRRDEAGIDWQPALGFPLAEYFKESNDDGDTAGCCE